MSSEDEGGMSAQEPSVSEEVSSVMRDLDTIEAFLTRSKCESAPGTKPKSSGLYVVAGEALQPQAYEEAGVDALRSQIEELVVHSHLMRSENNSLIAELQKSREITAQQAATIRLLELQVGQAKDSPRPSGDSKKIHLDPVEDLKEKHADRDSNRCAAATPQRSDSADEMESSRCFMERVHALLSKADVARLQLWMDTMDIRMHATTTASHPTRLQLTILEESDGGPQLRLQPPKRRPQAVAGGPSANQVTGSVPVPPLALGATPPSKYAVGSGSASKSLALHAWGPTTSSPAPAKPRLAVKTPTRTATTPLRSSSASLSRTTPVRTAPPPKLSISPGVSRRPVAAAAPAALAIVRPAGRALATTSPVASRKPSAATGTTASPAEGKKLTVLAGKPSALLMKARSKSPGLTVTVVSTTATSAAQDPAC